MLAASTPLVDWSALGQVIYISAGAALGVAVVLALGIVAALRADDAREQGNGGLGIVLNAGTAVAVLAVVAAIAVGINFILNK